MATVTQTQPTVNVTLITHVTPSGLELSLFPWEDASAYVAEIEAQLALADARPYLPLDGDEFPPVDWDAIVNDPAYDRFLDEQAQAGRMWSGSQTAYCDWSWLAAQDGPGSEFSGNLEQEPGYLESTQPWAF